MSLFDEIRLSFCNLSRHDITGLNCTEPYEKTSEFIDTSLMTAGTQTDQMTDDRCQNCNKLVIDDNMAINFGTQTEESKILDSRMSNLSLNKQNNLNESNKFKVETKNQSTNTSMYVLEVFKDIEVMNMGTQTDIESHNNNNNMNNCIDCTKCNECDRLNKYIKKLEKDLNVSNNNLTEMQSVLDKYEGNLNVLKCFVDEGNERNGFLKSVVDGLKVKLNSLERECEKVKGNEELFCETCCAEIQTDYGNFVIYR